MEHRYRRRSNVRHRPVEAVRAKQDIHGAWHLEHDPLHLYITPLHLVILKDDYVLESIPLEKIEKVGMGKRLDTGQDGLVRFTVHKVPRAFVVKNYAYFKRALSDATKGMLHDMGRKTKDDF